MVIVSGCSRATVSSEKPCEAGFQCECVWITAALLFLDVYKSGDAPKDTMGTVPTLPSSMDHGSGC